MGGAAATSPRCAAGSECGLNDRRRFGACVDRPDVEQSSESTRSQLVFEGGLDGVADGGDSKRHGGGGILFAVVDEEDVSGRGAQGFGRLKVDRGFGLGHEYGV